MKSQKYLLMDFGNSAFKLSVWQTSVENSGVGLFKESLILKHESIEGEFRFYDLSRNEVSLHKELKRLLSEEGNDFRGTALVSSVPAGEKHIHDVLDECGGKLDYLLSGRYELPFDIGYYDPEQLGPDRIAAVMGAFLSAPAETGGSVIAASFGTANTITVLHDREITGGAIAPGIELSFKALHVNTARLCGEIGSIPVDMRVRSPQEAMNTGIIMGSAAWLDDFVDRLEDDFGCSFFVAATGGSAEMVCPYSGSIDLLDEHLMMRGLAWAAGFHKNL